LIFLLSLERPRKACSTLCLTFEEAERNTLLGSANVLEGLQASKLLHIKASQHMGICTLDRVGQVMICGLQRLGSSKQRPRKAIWKTSCAALMHLYLILQFLMQLFASGRLAGIWISANPLLNISCRVSCFGKVGKHTIYTSYMSVLAGRQTDIWCRICFRG
jgi:hypothetical protein